MQPLVPVNWLQHQLPDPKDQREYAQQRAIVVVTEAIAEAMDQAGLKRADIAERLGQTKGHISQVLSGRRNMTLRTLGDVLWACNAELEDIKLAPLGEVSCPIEHAWDWYAALPDFDKAVTHRVFIDDLLRSEPATKFFVPADSSPSTTTTSEPLATAVPHKVNADLALAA